MINDKDFLVTLLTEKINADVLLKNSGESKADFLVLLEASPEKLLNKYINEQRKDLLFTVNRVREEPSRIRQNIPRTCSGFYQIKIWAIDKPGVDGNNLRELACAEVKRVFAENPAQRVFSEQEDDHNLRATQIYNSVFTVIKVTET